MAQLSTRIEHLTRAAARLQLATTHHQLALNGVPASGETGDAEVDLILAQHAAEEQRETQQDAEAIARLAQADIEAFLSWTPPLVETPPAPIEAAPIPPAPPPAPEVPAAPPAPEAQPA